MEQKRNKLWREQQCKRVFKARMIYYASFEHDVIDDEGAYSGGYPFSISGDIRSVPS